MCLALPNSSGNRFTGKPPGQVKLFFGGLVFLSMLLITGIGGLFRLKK
jgi:hypothetical protein